MLQELRASLVLIIVMTLLCGVIYPFVITGLGQTLFPEQASGSLIEKDGKIIGSKLIGQNFAGDIYFHPRPSAAGGGYDASNSSGSNLAPSAADLIKTITARVDELRKSGDARPIPVDLVTASGSGLDPDISVASAEFQAARVAAARNLQPAQIESMIADHTEQRSFGLLGEKRVNVLQLNIALDDLSKSATAP